MRKIRAKLPVQQQKFIIKRLCFSVVVGLTLFPFNAEAQISSDGTLPTVVEQSENMKKITGGERVGNNLFHSFKEFSIPEGIEAIFENGLDVENIFTRITGNDISVIDGLLKTAGGANFFLINPNGIVFGKNAVLDVGGSFIATTANRIEFADGTNFAAKGGEPKVTLTISVPIGLGLDGNNGSITVNGTGNQIVNDSSFSPIEFSQTPSGLAVNNEGTFALVANGINFDSGVVNTSGGNIYINSLSSGEVGISQTEAGLSLSDNNVNQYQDINFDRQSLVDASGEKVGAISVIGKNINLNNASFILSQNQSNLSDGLIEIKASESINLVNTSPNGEISSGIRSETLSTGESANITISTTQLSLQDESRIRANSFSDANAGYINISSSDLIQITNSTIGASAFAGGNAGNIQLSTSTLQVVDGGNLTSVTTGTGNGGEIIINADNVLVSGVFANDRAAISASSFSGSQDNPGNAGSFIINTAKLQVGDGGSISSSSFGTGDAGSLSINVSESIEVSGNNGDFQSTIRSAVETTSSAARSLFGLPEVPTGNSGNLMINVPNLNITEAGVVSVANVGTGSAGTLTINADNLNLDTSGKITAASESGTGGNILLNSQNLEIGNDSQITAEANNDGDGGNITINTANLIAKKNAQVTANAFQGRGGDINITTQGLFLSDSPENIFNASSELGIDGEVNINTTIDFQNSFDSISPEFILAEEALIGSCFTRSNSKQGSFVYKGTGGLPVSPSLAIDEEQSLSSQLPEVQPNSPTSHTPEAGFGDVSSSEETIIYPPQSTQKWQVGEPIIEPTNLIKTADGRLLWVRKQVDNASSLICQ